MFGDSWAENRNFDLGEREKKLLEKLIDLEGLRRNITNISKKDKIVLLFAAAQEGKTEAINILLGDPVDQDLLNYRHTFPQRYSHYSHPNTSILRLNKRLVQMKDSANALLFAIAHGKTEAAILLIKKGIKLD